jgi:acyl-CoA thioester hydrolase
VQLRNAVPEAAFSYESLVFFDELDPMKTLHNARYAVHVERATTAFYGSLGFRYEFDDAENPDQVHVVRAFAIQFEAPFRSEGGLTVRLWAERLGTSSCTYGFACASGEALHARGQRTIVKLDPATLRPAPWTEKFRTGHERVLAPAA